MDWQIRTDGSNCIRSTEPSPHPKHVCGWFAQCYTVVPVATDILGSSMGQWGRNYRPTIVLFLPHQTWLPKVTQGWCKWCSYIMLSHIPGCLQLLPSYPVCGPSTSIPTEAKKERKSCWSHAAHGAWTWALMDQTRDPSSLISSITLWLN